VVADSVADDDGAVGVGVAVEPWMSALAGSAESDAVAVAVVGGGDGFVDGVADGFVEGLVVGVVVGLVDGLTVGDEDGVRVACAVAGTPGGLWPPLCQANAT
jgi:hypothetical protein